MTRYQDSRDDAQHSLSALVHDGSMLYIRLLFVTPPLLRTHSINFALLSSEVTRMRFKAYVWNTRNKTYEEVTSLTDLSRFDVVEVQTKAGYLVLRLAIRKSVN